MLRAGGLFACELYEGALDAAAELCRQAGLSDVRMRSMTSPIVPASFEPSSPSPNSVFKLNK